MAILSAADRLAGYQAFVQEFMRLGGTATITKAELRAAFDALDQWLSDNAASANAAIPLPARSALTTQQKALLMQEVIRRRYLSGV